MQFNSISSASFKSFRYWASASRRTCEPTSSPRCPSGTTITDTEGSRGSVVRRSCEIKTVWLHTLQLIQLCFESSDLTSVNSGMSQSPDHTGCLPTWKYMYKWGTGELYSSNTKRESNHAPQKGWLSWICELDVFFLNSDSSSIYLPTLPSLSLE